MVKGIDSFREKFKDYSDCYTVIGGAACDILMTEADLSFRATKDIDMILIIEARYKEFSKTFWEYIKEGKYKCGWRNNTDIHFYRFTEPEPGYPAQIELFSRMPGYSLSVEEGIIPLHIDNDVSSLSAILLNDDFYNFMLQGIAWLELKERRAKGEHVNDRDLKKHKNDVFRLLQIVESGTKVRSEGLVKESIDRFLLDIKQEDLRLQQIRLPFDKETGISLLQNIYIN